MNARAVSRMDRPCSPKTKERAVIYHGIKILPITGKRSPLAETIRQALKDRAG